MEMALTHRDAHASTSTHVCTWAHLNTCMFKPPVPNKWQTRWLIMEQILEQFPPSQTKHKNRSLIYWNRTCSADSIRNTVPSDSQQHFLEHFRSLFLGSVCVCITQSKSLRSHNLFYFRSHLRSMQLNGTSEKMAKSINWISYLWHVRIQWDFIRIESRVHVCSVQPMACAYHVFSMFWYSLHGRKGAHFGAVCQCDIDKVIFLRKLMKNFTFFCQTIRRENHICPCSAIAMACRSVTVYNSDNMGTKIRIRFFATWKVFYIK